jgi:hypothetical protein
MLPNIKTDRLSRNPLTSCVGQARLDVRDAGQEDRIVLVPTVGTEDVYPVHLRTRKSSGDMMRKLSVTLSQSVLHRLGTSRRRKPSTALQKPL